MTTGRLLLSAWDFDPLVLVALAGAALAYRAYAPRWRARAGAFAAALALTAVALLSPVAVLARGTLFSAHMLQHLLLVLAVPPLALLALPARDVPPGPAAGSARSRLRPWQAWAAGVGAMWIWHEPSLCNAASSVPGVHAAQTISLLVLGAAFWWPILAPRRSTHLAPLAGVAYLFSACAACTALGILVTFSPVEVCSVYAHPADPLGLLPLVRERWGLTPAADQQLGGLLMWVPACLIYGGTILGMLARWYGADALRFGSRDPAHEGARP